MKKFHCIPFDHLATRSPTLCSFCDFTEQKDNRAFRIYRAGKAKAPIKAYMKAEPMFLSEFVPESPN